MSWPRRGRASGSSGSALVPLLALALVGCGDGDGAKRDAKPLGQPLAGSVAHLAQCKDWVGGSRERKLATIDDIRAQVNRRDTGVHAPPLSDDETLRLFDRACANRFARSFRLYVLYARAAGFAPLARDLPPP